jgi:hypothetical protein
MLASGFQLGQATLMAGTDMLKIKGDQSTWLAESNTDSLRLLCVIDVPPEIHSCLFHHLALECMHMVDK